MNTIWCELESAYSSAETKSLPFLLGSPSLQMSSLPNGGSDMKLAAVHNICITQLSTFNQKYQTPLEILLSGMISQETQRSGFNITQAIRSCELMDRNSDQVHCNEAAGCSGKKNVCFARPIYRLSLKKYGFSRRASDGFPLISFPSFRFFCQIVTYLFY